MKEGEEAEEGLCADIGCPAILLSPMSGTKAKRCQRGRGRLPPWEGYVALPAVRVPGSVHHCQGSARYWSPAFVRVGLQDQRMS